MSSNYDAMICPFCSQFYIPTPTTLFYCLHCHAPTQLSTLHSSDFVQNDNVNDNDNDHVVNLMTDTTFSYEPARPTPAATSFINSLKTHTLDPRVLKQLHTSSSSCAICSEEFKLGESVNRLPCRHWFHCDCVGKWLNLKNTCPLCRHEFPREPDGVLQRPPPPERTISSAAAITSTSVGFSQTAALRPQLVRFHRTARGRAAGGSMLPNRRVGEDTRIHRWLTISPPLRN